MDRRLFRVRPGLRLRLRLLFLLRLRLRRTGLHHRPLRSLPLAGSVRTLRRSLRSCGDGVPVRLVPLMRLRGGGVTERRRVREREADLDRRRSVFRAPRGGGGERLRETEREGVLPRRRLGDGERDMSDGVMERCR